MTQRQTRLRMIYWASNAVQLKFAEAELRSNCRPRRTMSCQINTVSNPNNLLSSPHSRVLIGAKSTFNFSPSVFPVWLSPASPFSPPNGIFQWETGTHADYREEDVCLQHLFSTGSTDLMSSCHETYMTAKLSGVLPPLILTVIPIWSLLCVGCCL